MSGVGWHKETVVAGTNRMVDTVDMSNYGNG